MTRAGVSRPVMTALEDDLLSRETSFFDYGYLTKRDFAKRYRAHQLLSVELHHGDYAGCGEIGAPIRDLLREQAATLDV